MTLQTIYFILSVLGFLFSFVTLMFVSKMRDMERPYNKSGVTAYMLGLFIAVIISFLYMLIYGNELLPGIFGSAIPWLDSVKGILRSMIDYGLYFLMAVIFLMSAYFLRKR